MSEREDEWLWGWDDTPGIVSVWAEPNGRALVWRRNPKTGVLVREDASFRPWMLLSSLRDLAHLGRRLRSEHDGSSPGDVIYRELEGPGALRYLVGADDVRLISRALLRGASRRLGREVAHLRELDSDEVVALPPEDQYLVASGRTYFGGLEFDDLRRLQLDLETTGLDLERDRIFMIAVRDPGGRTEVLEVDGEGEEAEGALLQRLVARIRSGSRRDREP
jgi:DNA polymerase I